jgi:uncharacterized protein
MTVARWYVLDWRRQVADLYRAVRLERDPRAAHALWVTGRNHLLSRHPSSPVPAGERDTYAGANIAPYDGDFRFVVEVDLRMPQTRRNVPTETDGVVPLDLVGRVTLPELGTLDVWWAAVYGGGIFLPVKDATSGKESYGGGRYVLDTVKGADLGGDPNGLVVDLNFAYQPSCAYDDAWVCPLPGTGNILQATVAVGELTR